MEAVQEVIRISLLKRKICGILFYNILKNRIIQQDILWWQHFIVDYPLCSPFMKLNFILSVYLLEPIPVWDSTSELMLDYLSIHQMQIFQVLPFTNEGSSSHGFHDSPQIKQFGVLRQNVPIAQTHLLWKHSGGEKLIFVICEYRYHSSIEKCS